jgi:peptidoglycan/LPS O-acetylase OafA/YrhL
MAALAIAEVEPRPKKAAVERFYQPELDCLRFFAFFGVFICHTLSGEPAYYAARHVPFPTLVADAVFAGRYGVDLFFLLSAYLITELLLREQEYFGKLDLRSFYGRRILRIWPLYFLGISIGVLLTFVDPREQFTWKYALAFAFMFGNLMISLKGAIVSAVFALWSVSFEEQFYLVWPAFISRARRESLLWASGVLLVIASLSRWLLLGYARQMHTELTIATNTLTRLDPIALGIATAVLLRAKRPNFTWGMRLGLLAVGYGLWVGAAHFWGLTLGYVMIGFPAVAAGAWLILISALGSRVAPRWLRYLGKISYGLYVFHGPALYIAAYFLGGSVHTLKTFIVYWCLGLTLTFGMAALSYRFFESPFLRLKERYARVRSRPV